MTSTSIDCMHNLCSLCKMKECTHECHDRNPEPMPTDAEAQAAADRLMAAVLGQPVDEPVPTEGTANFSDDCVNDHHVTCTYGDDGCDCHCHETVTNELPEVTDDDVEQEAIEQVGGAKDWAECTEAAREQFRADARRRLQVARLRMVNRGITLDDFDYAAPGPVDENVGGDAWWAGLVMRLQHYFDIEDDAHAVAEEIEPILRPYMMAWASHRSVAAEQVARVEQVVRNWRSVMQQPEFEGLQYTVKAIEEALELADVEPPKDGR